MRIYIYVEKIAARFRIHYFQTLEHRDHTFAEIFPVLVGIQCPACFCDSHRTRESLIIRTVGSFHIFSPEIPLHANHVFLYQLVGIVRDRIIAICLFQSRISADGSRSNSRIFLIKIQISIWHRSHNGIMPCFGSVQPAFYTTP